MADSVVLRGLWQRLLLTTFGEILWFKLRTEFMRLPDVVGMASTFFPKVFPQSPENPSPWLRGSGL